VDVFNVLGEKIKNVFNGYLPAGNHIFKWDGTNEFSTIQSSGHFLVVVRSNQMMKAVKITLLK